MSSVATETPGRKAIQRFYEGRLAERLLQAASLAANRTLLRRGARKQQDGTLGQPSGPAEEEPVNIRIGDEVHNHAAPTIGPTLPGPLSKLAGPALIAASLLGGGTLGAGVPWLLGAYNRVSGGSTTIVQPTVGQVLGIEVVKGGDNP